MSIRDDAAAPASMSAHGVPFAEAVRVWLKIGLLSFGGPAGQIALMHRILVEEKRWIGEDRFLHALNYCMVLPGPEAQQLATYIGWLLHRRIGGLVAGLLFVLPGALVMLALSVLYALYKDLTLVSALFFGIKAAVLAVVLEALLRIGRRALRNRALYAIAAAAFVAIYLFEVPFPLIVLGAGLIGFLGSSIAPGLFLISGPERSAAAPSALDAAFDDGRLAHLRPSARRALRTVLAGLAVWLGPLAVLWALVGGGSVWVQIGVFFAIMAVVTFGGAYAVLAYVAQEAVGRYGWLMPGEMLDGLGLAETTPGPLILVVQFVGFLAAFRHAGILDPLLAGCLGAALTLWVTFAPCFLWIFLGAPYVEALRGRARLDAALTAVTAAVTGVILNLAVWFALHVLFGEVVELRAFGMAPDLPVLATIDWRALLLSAAAGLMMLRFHLGMIPTLAASAAAGLLIFLLS